MLGFIDKKIEALMQKSLHKKREKMIAKALKDYVAGHPLDEAQTEELRERLESDTDRFLKIIDRSVLRAGLLRARYVFWITAIFGTAIVVALAAYPVTTSIAPFFVPLAAAFVGWAVSVATIPLSYIESIKGICAATIASYEKEMLEQQEQQDNELHKSNEPSVLELKQMLQQLKQQVEQLSQREINSVPPPPLNETYSDFTAASLTVSAAGMWNARNSRPATPLNTSNNRTVPLP